MFFPRLASVVALLSSVSLSAFEQPAPGGDVPVGARLIAADASATNDTLTFTLRTDGAEMTPWVQVFLDATDRDPGFRHPSGHAAGAGLDILLEGESAYRFTGAEASVWSWEPIPGGIVTRTLAGDTLTLRVPRAALELQPARPVSVFAASYTENYAATLDTLPRAVGSWTFTPSGAAAVPAQATLSKAPLPARADARAAFRAIRSYTCYYGPGRTAELLTRDAAIIEARAQTPADVNALRAAGRLAIGYISIGEDHNARIGDAKGPGGHDSAYFDRDGDGQPDKNAIWNSYFADADSPSWRAFFLENAARLRASHGVDGFFLDTVETCLLYPESRAGMVSLIRELRARHPDAVIVLNRGWDLLPELGDTPDGLMFESFTLTYDFAEKQYHPLRRSGWDYGLEVWQRLLRPAQEKHGLVVLALDYAASADAPEVKLAYDRAATLGLVPCVASIQLDSFYDISYVGVRDERWLSPQETPESRILKLDTARNGFPAGTLIRPSSNYADYNVAAVVDGVASAEAREALGWRDRAWASRESPGEHALEFSLPAPTRAATLEIEWAWDSGVWHSAREFRVEALPAGSTDWIGVARVTANKAERNPIALPARELAGLRIVQIAGGGSATRPDLMWVQQVRLVR